MAVDIKEGLKEIVEAGREGKYEYASELWAELFRTSKLRRSSECASSSS